MGFLAATRDWPAVKKLFRFVWEMRARDQIFLFRDLTDAVEFRMIARVLDTGSAAR